MDTSHRNAEDWLRHLPLRAAAALEVGRLAGGQAYRVLEEELAFSPSSSDQ